MGPYIPVILAQAGIQGYKHPSCVPLWTPDQVRGDDIRRIRGRLDEKEFAERGRRGGSISRLYAQSGGLI